MSRERSDEQDVDPRAQHAKDDEIDVDGDHVREASEESFPASDSPGWISEGHRAEAAPKPKPARPPQRPGR